MGKAAEQRTGQAQWLSLDEIERLLAWCEPGLIPPILVTLYSGVRTSEYRSVFYCESNNALRIRGFKTHRSDRCVPVHPVLRRVILGMPGPSSDRRILDLPELAVDRRNLLRSAALTAGLSLVGFCELRMTFINWLRISGAPVDVVAMLAGLSRPAFALSIDSKLLRKSIDRLPFVDLERVAELRQERMEHRPREAAPFCISGAELLTSRCVSHGAEATWLLWCSQHAESTARPRSGKAALRSTQTARLPRKGEETMRMGKAKTAADETVQEMLRAWFRRTFPVRLEGCSFFEARIEALIKGLPADLPIPKLTPMVIWNYTVTRRRQFGSTLQMIVDEVTILKVLVLGQRPSPDWYLPAHYVDVIGYLTAAPTTFSQAVR